MSSTDDTFRLVSDYGFGDKTWLERGLTTQEAIRALNRVLIPSTSLPDSAVVDTIEKALNYDHPIYSIERDHEDDEEDWDCRDA